MSDQALIEDLYRLLRTMQRDHYREDATPDFQDHQVCYTGYYSELLKDIIFGHTVGWLPKLHPIRMIEGAGYRTREGVVTVCLCYNPTFRKWDFDDEILRCDDGNVWGDGVHPAREDLMELVEMPVAIPDCRIVRE